MNALLGNNPKSTITTIDANEVSYVMNQLRACGVSLP
jgi:hypothetical protein